MYNEQIASIVMPIAREVEMKRNHMLVWSTTIFVLGFFISRQFNCFYTILVRIELLLKCFLCTKGSNTRQTVDGVGDMRIHWTSS